MLHQIPVAKEWQNPKDDNTMYSDSEMKALWDQSTYGLCPLFLCLSYGSMVYHRFELITIVNVSRSVILVDIWSHFEGIYVC